MKGINYELSILIEKEIKKFVEESPENRLEVEGDKKIWGQPLVGFSKGEDEFYEKYKQDIGDFYWTPIEAYELIFPKGLAQANELSIISWILPQTEETKKYQKKEEQFPCKDWVKARIYGEDFNKALAKHIVHFLDEKGYEAMAPMLSPFWKNETSEKYGYASSWSERHVAFISGLGTFGLSDGLITPVGKAMRCGSVIAKISVKPTERKYSRYNEYCLFFSKGTCMKCAERCPAKAIDENGHDKIKCRAYQREIITPFTKEEYELESACCGLCQTGVPCESRIPIVL